MARSTQSFTIRVMPALGDQLDLPLYDTSKIEYLGRFILPAGGGTIGGKPHDGFGASPEQDGGGIAYNPANNFLFVSGSTTNNDRVNTVLAEVSIPTPNLSGPFNRVSLLQDFTLACDLERQAEVNDGQAGNGAAPVSGILATSRTSPVAAIRSPRFRIRCVEWHEYPSRHHRTDRNAHTHGVCSRTGRRDSCPEVQHLIDNPRQTV
jgi:hypothetical protein